MITRNSLRVGRTTDVAHVLPHPSGMLEILDQNVRTASMSSARITLKSIAATLGLHVSTVSRVLNGDASAAQAAASPEMVKKIRDLATRLNYRPNIQAIHLKTRQSREIGVLMPRISDIVLATVYEGIDECAEEHGFTTFVSNTLDETERQFERVTRVLQREVAGIILTDTHIGPHQPSLDLLTEQRVPFVLAYRRHERFPSVAGDDYLGGRLVAEHLYRQGHRKVGVLAGERYAGSSLSRVRGFCGYFSEMGIEISKTAVIYGPIDAAAGRTLGNTLLTQNPQLSAVFAINDFLAIGLMGEARRLGRLIGQDLAIVGYNDIGIASELPIPLSSVQVPAREVGRHAFKLLLSRMQGDVPQSISFTPSLIVRESSARGV